jgi:TonB-linked SusC/RagA family outer membrane protein
MLSPLHLLRCLGFTLSISLLGTSVFSQTLAYASAKSHRSVQQQKETLRSVLKQLERKFEVRFNYASELVEGRQVATRPDLDRSSLDAALTQLLGPLGLRYAKINRNIYGIYPAAPKPPAETPKPSAPENPQTLLTPIDREPSPGTQPVGSLGLQPAVRVDKVISGQVTDANNEPLPGVNIVLKGTTTGASTNAEGTYRINVPDEAATLVFSYVGYTNQEVVVGNRTVIDVRLEADVRSLSEVVVVGYGTQKKSDLTGAVSSISSQDVTRVSERRLETALQGRAPGVTVTRSDGAPGAESRVAIRGTGSLGANNPLYIIDGVPQDPGSFFNPQDVESIEVLKDASSAAIYGARAAHGVVLITTKRGNSGKVKLNVTSSTGIRRATQLPDALNTPDYIQLASEARRNAGVALEPSWANPGALPNTNWFDVLFRPAREQSHNVSVTGGGKNASFFLSGAYDREEGIYIDNVFERFSLRANSDFKIGKLLKVGESLVISRVFNNPTADEAKDLEFAIRAIPTYNPRDPANPLGGYGLVPAYNNGVNPLGIQEQTREYSLTRRINGNAYAELEPLAGLKLRGSVGYNYGAGLFRSFIEAYNYGQQALQKAQLRYLSNDDESYNLNLVLSYQKSLKGHNVSALAGVERFTQDGINFDIIGTNFPVRFSESLALANDNTFTTLNRNTINDQYRLNSVFGRITYDYQGKYLFTGNIRRDGSSRFGPNEKFGVFPSASVGWRISQEAFMQGISWLTDLKLRASYGVLGSDRIGDYIFDANYTSERSTYPFNVTGITGGTISNGFYLASFSNRSVQWEQVDQLDIGLDFSAFKNQFTVTADYYKKTTDGLLVNVPLPLSFGVGTESVQPRAIPVNVGSMTNTGFELAATYRQTVRDWRFDLSANSAWVTNRVNNLSANQEITRNIGNSAITGAITRTVARQPVGAFYGYIVDGIFQTQEEITALNRAAPTGVYQQNGTAPGDFRYRDVSGDGRIDAADRTTIGNPIPRMTYALNATVGFKGLDLTVFFQGVQGVDVFNAPKAYYRNFFNDYNSTAQAFDRWTAASPGNTHPRLTVNDPNGNFKNPSTYFVEDASYLKLRNIQLGYTLPSALLGKVGLSNARIYVNAQNILTLTKYDGLDPEVSNGDGNNTAQGVDNLGRYPQTYLVSGGIQLSF